MSVLTPQMLASWNTTSVVPVRYEIRSMGADAEHVAKLDRSAADDLAQVRALLKPTVLELANLFGVSRQAVYDWQTGALPATQTAERLAQLARAADVFDRANLVVAAKILRRKVVGGGTLLDAVLNGGNAEEVDRNLVPTLQREAAQRERLQLQLAGRKRVPVNPDDYGAPALSDDV